MCGVAAATPGIGYSCCSVRSSTIQLCRARGRLRPQPELPLCWSRAARGPCLHSPHSTPILRTSKLLLQPRPKLPRCSTTGTQRPALCPAPPSCAITGCAPQRRSGRRLFSAAPPAAAQRRWCRRGAPLQPLPATCHPAPPTPRLPAEVEHEPGRARTQRSCSPHAQPAGRQGRSGLPALCGRCAATPCAPSPPRSPLPGARAQHRQPLAAPAAAAAWPAGCGGLGRGARATLQGTQQAASAAHRLPARCVPAGQPKSRPAPCRALTCPRWRAGRPTPPPLPCCLAACRRAQAATRGVAAAAAAAAGGRCLG